MLRYICLDQKLTNIFFKIRIGFSKSDSFIEISNACNDIDELELKYNSQYSETEIKIVNKYRSKKITTNNSNEESIHVCEKVLNEVSYTHEFL
jgi:hypothetical protein